MTEVLVLRGIPGSGKSTFANNWVAESRSQRSRVNRDDTRMQLFGLEFGVDEDAVTKVEHAMLEALLRSGKSVVVDDTNIRHKYIQAFLNIALKCGAGFSIKEFPVDLDVALERVASRAAAGGRNVPPEATERMFKAFRASGPFKFVQGPAIAPYVAPSGNSVRDAYLFDIDGTLAKMTDRGPFDWHRVDEDEAVADIAEMLDNLEYCGYRIIVMSGRDESCRDLTKEWLRKNGIKFHDLFMRPEGDFRKDNVVKLELFDKHVRDFYRVAGVFDDRQQVVDMWRELGLTCMQVAPGNF